ncbi:MAG: STAS-like domain-containing protein [Caulobacter sp.]|nr:STAS-like domain-containing protein [Caulobacter sp.]
MRRIEISKFSRFPFGRLPSHGPNSGERFREELLMPAIRDEDRVVVVLDGANGLSPSFLEEAFGGLVRLGVSAAEIHDKVEIVSDSDPSYIPEIWGYVDDAAAHAG